MDLLDLYAKVILDKSQYESGIEEVKGTAEQASYDIEATSNDRIDSIIGKVKDLAAVAGSIALVSGIAKGVDELATYGDAIDKTSQKLGVSSQFYQEWDAVLQHSGTSMSAMSGSFVTLASAVQETSDEQAKYFEMLGLNVEELRGMSTEDAFETIIFSLQNMESGTQRTAAATSLLGRGAREMGALFNTSSKDTKVMIDRVNQLNGVLGNDAVKQSARYKDSIQDLQTAFNGAKNEMLIGFIPAASDVMDALTETLAQEDTQEFLQNVGDLLGNIIGLLTPILTGVIEIGSFLSPLILEPLNAIFDVGNTIFDAFDRFMYGTGDYITEASLFGDQIRENTQLINDQTQAFQEQENAARVNAEAAGKEYDAYSILLDELDDYIEADGTIKQGYEERVAVINGILSEAFGVEIEGVGETREAYEKLREEIEKTIAQERIKAQLAAYEDLYNAALIEQKTAIDNITSARRTRTEAEGKLNLAIQEQNELQELLNSGMANNSGEAYEMIKRIEELQLEIDDYNIAIGEANNMMDAAQEEYRNAMAVLDNYSEAQRSVIDGSMSDMSNAIAKLTGDFHDHTNATLSELEEQKKGYEDQMQTMLEIAREGGYELSQETIEQLEYLISQTEEEIKAASKAYYSASYDAGTNFAQGIADGTNKNSYIVSNAAYDLGRLAAKNLRVALDINSPSKVTQEYGRFFDLGFAEGVEDNADEVMDSVSALAEDVTKEFDAIGSDVDINTDNITADVSGSNTVSWSMSDQTMFALRSAIAEALANQPIVINNNMDLDGDVLWEKSVEVNRERTIATGINAMMEV